MSSIMTPTTATYLIRDQESSAGLHILHSDHLR